MYSEIQIKVERRQSDAANFVDRYFFKLKVQMPEPWCTALQFQYSLRKNKVCFSDYSEHFGNTKHDSKQRRILKRWFSDFLIIYFRVNLKTRWTFSRGFALTWVYFATLQSKLLRCIHCGNIQYLKEFLLQCYMSATGNGFLRVSLLHPAFCKAWVELIQVCLGSVIASLC